MASDRREEEEEVGLGRGTLCSSCNRAWWKLLVAVAKVGLAVALRLGEGGWEEMVVVAVSKVVSGGGDTWRSRRRGDGGGGGLGLREGE